MRDARQRCFKGGIARSLCLLPVETISLFTKEVKSDGRGRASLTSMFPVCTEHNIW